VDLRWARKAENLSLRHSQFRGAILDIAAPLHGRPKDELDRDDVGWHRRTKRLVWSAVIVILIAACVAGWEARVARLHQREAEAAGEREKQQRLRAEDATWEANTQRDQATYQKGVADQQRRKLSGKLNWLLRVNWRPRLRCCSSSTGATCLCRSFLRRNPRGALHPPKESSSCGAGQAFSRALLHGCCSMSFRYKELLDLARVAGACWSAKRKPKTRALTDLGYAAFSANGQILGYRDEGGTVRFIDLTSGREVWDFQIDGVDSLVISRAAQYVAVQTSGTSGKSIQAYRFGNSSPIFQETCEAFAIRNDGTLIAASVGLSDYKEMNWNVQTHLRGDRADRVLYPDSGRVQPRQCDLALTDKQDLVLGI
jgi:hypothetical protein